MNFLFFRKLSNFSFFKVFLFDKFFINDAAFLVACFISFFVILFIFLIIYKMIILVYRLGFYFFIFFRLIIFFIKNYLFKFWLSLLILVLLCFYRVRFFFLLGSSNYDSILKSSFDNLFILKNELLMSFYNFGHRFVFENHFNMPVSIFQYQSIFDSGKNFFFLKIYYNLFYSLNLNYQKNRSFLYYNSQFFNFFLSEKASKLNAKGTNFVASLFGVQWISSLFVNFLLFVFNFAFINYFLFLKFLYVKFLNRVRLSFLAVVVLKYLTFLKSTFLFLLINFENDSFLNYVNITLHKLSRFNYYNDKDWQTLINTYDFYLTNSKSFVGDLGIDRYFLFKVSFYYFFLYLNFLLFFCFSIFVLILKIFFFFIFSFIFLFDIKKSFLIDKVSFFISVIFLFFFHPFEYFLFLLDKYKFNGGLLWLRFKLASDSMKMFLYSLFLKISIVIRVVCDYFIFSSGLLFFYERQHDVIFSSNFFKTLVSWIGSEMFFEIYLQNLFLRVTTSGFFFFDSNLQNQDFSWKVLKKDMVINRDAMNFVLFSDVVRMKFFFANILFYKFLRTKIIIPMFKFKDSFILWLIFKLFSVDIFSKFSYQEQKNVLAMARKNFMEWVWKRNIFVLYIDLMISMFIIRFFYFFYNMVFLCWFFFNNFFVFFDFLRINLFSLLMFFIKSLILVFLFFFHVFYGFFMYTYVYILFFIFVCFLFFLIYFCLFLMFLKIQLLILLSLLLLLNSLVLMFVFYFKSYFWIFPWFVWFFIFFKVLIDFIIFYFRLFSFLFSRNLGLLQIFSIIFSVRNELKKYEFVQLNLFFNTLNIWNSEFLTSNLLSQWYYKNKNRNLAEHSSVLQQFPVYYNSFVFPRIFSKFNLYENRLQRLRSTMNVSNYAQVRLQSDIFPEFEYHKYLRFRSLRNLQLFRFRKSSDPFDLYVDKNVDPLFFFKSSSEADINFLRIFYKNDFFYNKDLKNFRSVFARRNLSFFYDELDKKSAFRFKFNKISPLFRYFYLKRERFKYILTLYNFGNVNSYSFSSVSNWILNYRLLRAVLSFFEKKNFSLFIRKNFFFSCDFSLVRVSCMLDQFVSIVNLSVKLLLLFILFVIIFIFSSFYVKLMGFLFFSCYVYFCFFVEIKYSAFFVKYCYVKPLNLTLSMFARAALFHKFFFFGVRRFFVNFFMKFFFFINFSLLFRFFYFFFVYLFLFLSFFFIHLRVSLNEFVLLFQFFDGFFFEKLGPGLCFSVYNSEYCVYSIVWFLNLEVIYLVLLAIILRVFIFFFCIFFIYFAKIDSVYYFLIMRVDLLVYNLFFWFFDRFFSNFFFKVKLISVFCLLHELDFVIDVLSKTNNYIKQNFLKK